MGNAKKLLGNKNVVTLLGMILVAVVLYLFYIYNVKTAVDSVSIPIANKNIEPMKEIQASMIAKVDVPKAALRGNVIYAESQLTNGMYSGVNSYIPNGSFFYYSSAESAGNIISKRDLPTAFLEEFDLDKDVVAYSYPVTTMSSYSNSIVPGKYIDIYLRILKEDGSYDVGKLVSNVKVLAVKDSSGRNVFVGTNEQRTPAMVIFGVDSETNYYLRSAENLGDMVDLIAVPNNSDNIYKTDVPETNMPTSELKEYLGKYVEYLPDEAIEDNGSDVTPVEN